MPSATLIDPSLSATGTEWPPLPRILVLSSFVSTKYPMLFACATENRLTTTPPDGWLQQRSSNVPNNLPSTFDHHITGLIARQDEVRDLQKRLQNKRNSLVAIVGPGGFGRPNRRKLDGVVDRSLSESPLVGCRGPARKLFDSQRWSWRHRAANATCFHRSQRRPWNRLAARSKTNSVRIGATYEGVVLGNGAVPLKHYAVVCFIRDI